MLKVECSNYEKGEAVFPHAFPARSVSEQSTDLRVSCYRAGADLFLSIRKVPAGWQDLGSQYSQPGPAIVDMGAVRIVAGYAEMASGSLERLETMLSQARGGMKPYEAIQAAEEKLAELQLQIDQERRRLEAMRVVNDIAGSPKKI